MTCRDYASPEEHLSWEEAEINAARCLSCGDIILSTYRHDFQECSCGSLFVDGGLDYHRRGWFPETPWRDLSSNEEGDKETKNG